MTTISRLPLRAAGAASFTVPGGRSAIDRDGATIGLRLALACARG
jgi:hypothetical protein